MSSLWDMPMHEGGYHHCGCVECCCAETREVSKQNQERRESEEIIRDINAKLESLSLKQLIGLLAFLE